MLLTVFDYTASLFPDGKFPVINPIPPYLIFSVAASLVHVLKQMPGDPNFTYDNLLAPSFTSAAPYNQLYEKTTRIFLLSPQLQTYYSILLYILIAAILCIVLAALAYLLSLSTSQDTEKRSEYECGFEPFDSATRLPFDVHFYLIGILFLIFDVEIALLFP